MLERRGWKNEEKVYLAVLPDADGHSGDSARRRFAKQPPVEVTAITLQPQLVEQTVSCSGKVEAAKSQNVYLDMPCVAGEVYVQAGQEVRQGDVLFTVDVGATKQVLAQAGGLAASQITDDLITKEVTATASGIISTLNVVSGSLTDTSKPCAVIASSDMLRVKIAVREQDLQKVAIGQRVTITGSGFRKPSYTGVLTELASSARQQIVGTVTDTVVDAVVMFDQDQMDPSLRVGPERQGGGPGLLHPRRAGGPL